MNLKKAIEILNDLALTGVVSLDQDDVAAIKLGISALGQFTILRKAWPPFANALLPGETEN